MPTLLHKYRRQVVVSTTRMTVRELEKRLPLKEKGTPKFGYPDLPSPSNRPMIGILGGMGPGATNLFERKLIQEMNASTDQDHIPSLSLNATWVPDRTTSIQDGSLQMMNAVARGLRQGTAILRDAGVSVICMPCNTAHTWYDDIAEEAGPNIRVLHMIDLLSQRMKEDSVRKIALLATHGTRQSRIYEKSVEKIYSGQPFQFLYPTPEEQKILYDQGILAIKSGVPGRAVSALQEPCIRRLLQEGAERIVLGCTEIPLIFEDSISVASAHDTLSCLVDPMDILAQVAVGLCEDEEDTPPQWCYSDA